MSPRRRGDTEVARRKLFGENKIKTNTKIKRPREAGERVKEVNKELRSVGRKKPKSKTSGQKSIAELLRMPGAAEIDFDPPCLKMLLEPAEFSPST